MKKGTILFLFAVAGACAPAATDLIDISEVFAPVVVGVPPAAAVRDLCRTADGEIRHYGWRLRNGKKERIYVASRDNGLNWVTCAAHPGEAESMMRSPWSGEWIGFESEAIVRSKVGPGDTNPQRRPLGIKRLELRQLVPLTSRRRWIAAFSDVACLSNECYRARTAYSDDDGRTWVWVSVPPVDERLAPRLHPGDKRPHWYNNGCEPSVVELHDGSLLLAVRTSGEHVCFFASRDGGASWGECRADPAFWAANTMPYLFRLSDGRLLFFWNNTAMLPTRDPSETPELDRDALNGRWEAVFTNRDALHAALSEDDGRTWRGFRELALNEARNAGDFRELGNRCGDEHDKSVHQTQALELPGGKVLLAYGQNRASRRMLIFDPDWLLETRRTDDFGCGLGNLSTHLYVKSLSGGARGWAGHCAWNRMPGATLVRDPETDAPAKGAKRSVRELLQLTRIRDPRLVSDTQGVVWNFPAGRIGEVKLECRIVGAGFRLSLADHWMNPCDETGPKRSPLSVEVTARDLPNAAWHLLSVRWDEDAGEAVITVDGRVHARHPLASRPPFGLSYLHLQTLAEDTDPNGTYFRRFSAERLDK